MKPKKNQNQSNTNQSKEMYLAPFYTKYINPFTDFGFKKLFGQECNKDLLLDFLNELLFEEQGKIVTIAYLNPERLGLTKRFEKRK